MFMAHRRKKIVKKRGTRTCGQGGMRKRRGTGNRGGVGYAGSKKHRKSWIMKYEPDHLGKRGFVGKSDKCVKITRVISLTELETLARNLEAGKNDIDIGEFGFDKVLGSGKMTRNLNVKAKSFSRHAKEKIEAAGGKALSE
jgi:large subunit ribosomal protein L15